MGSRLLALVLALVLSGVVGGCSAVPGAVVPSPACGGFHLAVRNTGSAAVIVRVNGLETSVVEGHGSGDISEWGSPSAGVLPWKVDVVDAATGTVIATRDVTASSGDGAATLEVKADGGGAPAVGELQSGKGC